MESELLLVARQADRSCTFEIEGLSDNFWVVRFSGSEGISALYEFHLDVVARHIEVGELVGRSALLKVVGVGEPRLVHGIILRAEYTGEMRPPSRAPAPEADSGTVNVRKPRGGHGNH